MYKKNNRNWIKHWDFMLIDIICIEIAFWGSYIARHVNEEFINSQMYLRLGILLIVFVLIAVFLNNAYKGIIQREKWEEFIAIIRHVTLINGLLLLYEYVIKEVEDLSRTVFLTSWFGGVVLCWCCRLMWKEILRKRLLKKENQSKMLLISTPEHADLCIKRLYKKTYRNFEVTAIAFLKKVEKMSPTESDILKIYGNGELIEYVKKSVVDEVYIDTFEDRAELEKLVQLFLQMGIAVHIGMEVFPSNMPNCFVEKIGENNVVTTSVKMASGVEITLKRLMDIIGGLVGIVLTGIAYIFVAPAIKNASPGPVFFKQPRVGKNGRIFYIYKFRSMYLDAEERKEELLDQNEMKGLMFKMENDPRVIGSEKGPGKGIGNFIRRTSIDELPQFWNILKGDMSLVGTRPPTVNEYEQYDLRHKIRLSAKPGLTGMWQTRGRSDINDFEEVVKLDTEYIENWSLLLDVKLILKTINVVLSRKGSR